MRVSSMLLFSLSLGLLAACVHRQPAEPPAYTEVFYPSGALRIQAYLYKPAGDGPFPVVIYNHGKRGDKGARRSVPLAHIGRMMTQAGYAALVVERRGYGRSDGQTLEEEVRGDRQRLIPRLQAEVDDVLASLDYLRTLPFVDMQRIGIMGASHGGMITLLASSRSRAFAVAVDQSGGALTWKGNPAVRAALIDAAEKTTTPTLLMIAENDRTTDSITTVAGILERRGVPHRAVIYSPFTPTSNPGNVPPGHRIFSEEGMPHWQRDVLEFLGRYFGEAKPAQMGS